MNGTGRRNRSLTAKGMKGVAMYKPFESISQSVASDMAPLIAEPWGAVLCPTSMI
jgi:hypothetical protein